jgi:hypothetical protein
MNNIMYRMMSLQANRYYRIMLIVLASMSFITLASAQYANNATNSIYCVFQTVQTAIFILGVALMLLGGALYAGAHLLPGSSKGSLQGYGMGMILGGIIGVIIAVLSPYILQIISGNTSITALPAGLTC